MDQPPLPPSGYIFPDYAIVQSVASMSSQSGKRPREEPSSGEAGSLPAPKKQRVVEIVLLDRSGLLEKLEPDARAQLVRSVLLRRVEASQETPLVRQNPASNFAADPVRITKRERAFSEAFFLGDLLTTLQDVRYIFNQLRLYDNPLRADVSKLMGEVDAFWLQSPKILSSFLNYLDDNGFNLLHWACITGAPITVIDDLIQAGYPLDAELSCDEGESFTPLYCAVVFGHQEIVRNLIEREIAAGRTVNYSVLLTYACRCEQNKIIGEFVKCFSIYPDSFDLTQHNRYSLGCLLHFLMNSYDLRFLRFIVEKGIFNDLSQEGQFSVGDVWSLIIDAITNANVSQDWLVRRKSILIAVLFWDVLHPEKDQWPDLTAPPFDTLNAVNRDFFRQALFLSTRHNYPKTEHNNPAVEEFVFPLPGAMLPTPPPL